MLSDARLKELVALAEKATAKDAKFIDGRHFRDATNPATIISMAQALLEAREQIAALLNDKAQMQAERKEHRP